jgi:peptidoglycan/LPS O-acetylase OafA/YrhL
MRTIQNQLDFVQNRPSGFDYLRLILAISVIAVHSVMLCSGQFPFWTGPLRPLVCFILPSFFALSGFLVTGSFERNTIPAFFTLRALRIFPALAVEVLISALIIGPLLTTVSHGRSISPVRNFSATSSILLDEYIMNCLTCSAILISNFVNVQLLDSSLRTRMLYRHYDSCFAEYCQAANMAVLDYRRRRVATNGP